MLPGLFARWVPDARRRRRLAWGYALLLALLLLLPFLVRPEIQESGPGSGRGGGRLRGMILGIYDRAALLPETDMVLPQGGPSPSRGKSFPGNTERR